MILRNSQYWPKFLVSYKINTCTCHYHCVDHIVHGLSTPAADVYRIFRDAHVALATIAVSRKKIYKQIDDREELVSTDIVKGEKPLLEIL